jgi:hypothetical protein
VSPHAQMVIGGIAVFLVFLTALVPIIGGFLQAHRDRQWTHLERIKALELGKHLPDDATTAQIKAAFGQVTESTDRGSLARKCYSTAIWVAFWGFMAASSHVGAGMSSTVVAVIAAWVGAVAVTAVICGTILASHVAEVPPHLPASKPATEADSFDVVASRGY